MIKKLRAVTLLAATIAVAAIASPAAAQSPEQFVGDWTLTFEPMGGGAGGGGARPGGAPGGGGGGGGRMGARTPMVVHVTQSNGALAATITGGMAGAEPITASNPHLMNGGLMLSYTMSMGGQSAPITLTLTPDGAGMKALMDIAGMAQRNGTATKQ